MTEFRRSRLGFLFHPIVPSNKDARVEKAPYELNMDSFPYIAYVGKKRHENDFSRDYINFIFIGSSNQGDVVDFYGKDTLSKVNTVIGLGLELKTGNDYLILQTVGYFPDLPSFSTHLSIEIENGEILDFEIKNKYKDYGNSKYKRVKFKILPNVLYNLKQNKIKGIKITNNKFSCFNNHIDTNFEAIDITKRYRFKNLVRSYLYFKENFLKS